MRSFARPILFGLLMLTASPQAAFVIDSEPPVLSNPGAVIDGDPAPASKENNVPEPAALLLLGLGLFVIGRRLRLSIKSRSVD